MSIRVGMNVFIFEIARFFRMLLLGQLWLVIPEIFVFSIYISIVILFNRIYC